MVAGVLIILTGIGLLLDGLGIISFSLFDLLPLLLVYFGIRLWNQEKRMRGGILLFLGMVILLEMWFSIGPFDLFELVIPLLLIYFGFRLIRGRSWEKEDSPLPREDSTARQERKTPISHAAPHAVQAGWQGWGRRRMRGRLHAETNAGVLPGGILRPKDTRSSLIGDFHLTSGRFELDHLQIWHGIGNVVIDLSRAILLREEAVLSVEGWIGDVTIYVPVDLPVSVSAEVSVGDLEVFGHRQGGISRSIIIRSENFDQDAQRILLHVSLLVGDVKVKYI
jgi:lia operon protein LiaF